MRLMQYKDINSRSNHSRLFTVAFVINCAMYPSIWRLPQCVKKGLVEVTGAKVNCGAGYDLANTIYMDQSHL